MDLSCLLGRKSNSFSHYDFKLVVLRVRRTRFDTLRMVFRTFFQILGSYSDSSLVLKLAIVRGQPFNFRGEGGSGMCMIFFFDLLIHPAFFFFLGYVLAGYFFSPSKILNEFLFWWISW